MCCEDVSDEGLFVGQFKQPKLISHWKESLAAAPPEKAFKKKGGSSSTTAGDFMSHAASIGSSANEASPEHCVILHGSVQFFIWLGSSGEGALVSFLDWSGV